MMLGVVIFKNNAHKAAMKPTNFALFALFYLQENRVLYSFNNLLILVVYKHEGLHVVILHVCYSDISYLRNSEWRQSEDDKMHQSKNSISTSPLASRYFHARYLLSQTWVFLWYFVRRGCKEAGRSDRGWG